MVQKSYVEGKSGAEFGGRSDLMASDSEPINGACDKAS